MHEFDKIYLTWRKEGGERRETVGLLERTPDGKYCFKYLPKAAELKRSVGFVPYPEFSDLEKVYNGNVLDIFGQRLMKTERPDIKSFYDFWEVDPKMTHDKFYLLGKTQGLLATDNFEFLAEYKECDHVHFLTELAGLTHLKLPRGTLVINEELQFRPESKNSYDPMAIMVLKGQQHVGYIKKIHTAVFHECRTAPLRIKVRALEENGFVKRIFVRVSNEV